MPEILESFSERPAMHIAPVNFDTVAAFLTGAHFGSQHALLEGFREWLVVKLGYGNNLVWEGLVLAMAFSERGNVGIELKSPEEHQKAIDLTFLLLREFFELEEGRRTERLRHVFLEHEAWLRKQSWYRPRTSDGG